MDTWRTFKALEGRPVAVTINREPLEEQTGTLLYLDGDGTAVLHDPDTLDVITCWPVLEVREVAGHRRPGLWARKAGLIAKLAVLAAITATVITLVLLTTVAVVR